MSFSDDLKRELLSVRPERDCCVFSELSALTQSIASLSLKGRGRMQLTYRAESLTTGRRLLYLLRHRLGLQLVSRIQRDPRFGGRYISVLTLALEDSRRLLRRMKILQQNERGEDVFQGPSRRVMRRICCRRAFIRGMYMGCGSVSHPQKAYHAEFSLADASKARFLQRVLLMSDLSSSIIERNGRFVVYIKNSEMIARLFVTMGAPKTLVRLEEIRTKASIRQQATRATNCDHANINRQLTAAYLQAQAISAISRRSGLSILPPSLEELAHLRLTHLDASLEELGKMLTPPISKSGVQYRMQKLMRIAQEEAPIVPTPAKEGD